VERIEIRSNPMQEALYAVLCLGLLGVVYYFDGRLYELNGAMRLFMLICVPVVVIGVPVRLALGADLLAAAATWWLGRRLNREPLEVTVY
jgi:hypothetical protein